MKNLINKIDNLIIEIKNKIEKGGQGAADIFIILTLEIVRAEIINERLSDFTIDALREISATTSHFYYYRDYRELYDELHIVYLEISKLDKKFYDADFTRSIGYEISSWINYINKASLELLNNLPTSYKINYDNKTNNPN